MAGMREVAHQSFDHVTSEHVIKGRAAGHADENRVYLKLFSCFCNRLGGVVGDRPYRDHLDILALDLL